MMKEVTNFVDGSRPAQDGWIAQRNYVFYEKKRDCRSRSRHVSRRARRLGTAADTLLEREAS